MHTVTSNQTKRNDYRKIMYREKRRASKGSRLEGGSVKAGEGGSEGNLDRKNRVLQNPEVVRRGSFSFPTD